MKSKNPAYAKLDILDDKEQNSNDREQNASETSANGYQPKIQPSLLSR